MITLKVKDLSKNFGSTEVLKKINLEIEEGNFLVLLGASGCGKSTLLNIIAGLETIDEGTVFIDDVIWYMISAARSVVLFYMDVPFL